MEMGFRGHSWVSWKENVEMFCALFFFIQFPREKNLLEKNIS
jgi:hypothetical protein